MFLITRVDQIEEKEKKTIIREYYSIPFKELIHKTKLSRQEIISILLDSNIKIKEEDIFSNNIKDNKIIIISDTHIGSELENISYIDLVYEFATKNNINKIIHCGDLFQSNIKPVSKHFVNQEKQIEHFIKEYPYSRNITTYITYGNHDLHLFNRIENGLNLLKERKDLKPLGFKRTYIKWLNNTISICHECPKYRLQIPNLNSFLVLHGHRHNLKVTNNGSIFVPTLSDDVIEYGDNNFNMPGFLVAYFDGKEIQIEKYSVNYQVLKRGLVFTKRL